MRTDSDIKKNDEILLILYMFGVKTIFMNYRHQMLHEIIENNIKEEFRKNFKSGAPRVFSMNDN